MAKRDEEGGEVGGFWVKKPICSAFWRSAIPDFVQSDLGKEGGLFWRFVGKMSDFDTKTQYLWEMPCSNRRFYIGVEKNSV